MTDPYDPFYAYALAENPDVLEENFQFRNATYRLKVDENFENYFDPAGFLILQVPRDVAPRRAERFLRWVAQRRQQQDQTEPTTPIGDQTMTDTVQPYDLPVTITIGESALRGVAQARHHQGWAVQCMGNNIARIIRNALSEALYSQMPDNTDLGSYDIEQAITVTVNDGYELFARSDEVNGPVENEYSVTLTLDSVVVGVTASDYDEARQIALDNWRELVDFDSVDVYDVTDVELD